MAYAHSRGVIHRDLKGQNVVLGDFGEVMVLDWGFAKELGTADCELQTEESRAGDNGVGGGGSEQSKSKVESADCTIAGQVLGTPAYMVPEQAEGRLDLIDRRTDVYGLGTILYEILAGRPPFEGVDTQDILRNRGPTVRRDPRHNVPACRPRLRLFACVRSRAIRQHVTRRPLILAGKSSGGWQMSPLRLIANGRQPGYNALLAGTNRSSPVWRSCWLQG